MTARSYWKVLYWGSAPSITFIVCISKSHFIQSLNYTGECLNCVCLCLSFFNLDYVKHTSFSLGLIKFSNSDSDFRFINLLMCQSSRLGFRVFKVQIILTWRKIILPCGPASSTSPRHHVHSSMRVSSKSLPVSSLLTLWRLLSYFQPGGTPLCLLLNWRQIANKLIT